MICSADWNLSNLIRGAEIGNYPFRYTCFLSNVIHSIYVPVYSSCPQGSFLLTLTHYNFYSSEWQWLKMLTCLQISKWSQHFIAELRLKTIQYFMDQMTFLENTEGRQSLASPRVWVTNTVLFSRDAIFWVDMYFCIGYATYRAIMESFVESHAINGRIADNFPGQWQDRDRELLWCNQKQHFSYLIFFSESNQQYIFSYIFLLRLWGSTKTSARISLHCTSVCCHHRVEIFRFVFSNQFKDAFNFIRWFPFVCVKMVLLSSCFTFSFIGGS